MEISEVLRAMGAFIDTLLFAYFVLLLFKMISA
ncbi:hypothetical protein J2X32_004015 [Rheinheimera pacifica]|nr:hypothetical protein [Rheinheimera pacifica]